jgi:hypothetical protein
MNSQTASQQRLEVLCEALFDYADRLPAQVIDEENGHASLWAITPDGFVIKIDSVQEHYWVFTLGLSSTVTDATYTTDPAADRSYKEIPEYAINLLQRAVPIPGMRNLIWVITDSSGIAELVSFYRPVHRSQLQLSMALFVRRDASPLVLMNRLYSQGYLDPLEFWNCVREKIVKPASHTVIQSQLPSLHYCIIVEGQPLAHPHIWEELAAYERLPRPR